MLGNFLTDKMGTCGNRDVLIQNYTENTMGVTCEQVLSKLKKKGIFFISIIKRQLIFLEHILREKSLENLKLTWHFEGKREIFDSLPEEPI